jgi:IS6 family transposase
VLLVGCVVVNDRQMLLVSILYQLVRGLLGLIVVVVRRDLSKDAELLVLQHENTVLRRQVARVHLHARRPGLAGRLVPVCPGLLHRWRTRSWQAEVMRRRRVRVPAPKSSFAGFRFPPEVIMVAVRWYLRYGLSYRDVEELLAERGIAVDHVTVYRWVQRFTPLLLDAARPCRHAPGDRWLVDEMYVKVAGRWVSLYRAIDQFGQVIDVLVAEKRDLAATRRFFTRALEHGARPSEVNTDRASAYLRVLDELLPSACHVMKQYANNPIESDHGRLKSRLRPMRGLKQLRSARVISSGHAFVQNLRRGHYELSVELDPQHRLPAASAELALAI